MEYEQYLTKEQAFFLKVLSDYINGTATSLPDNVELSTLTKLSNSQQLSPITYYQTNIPGLQSAFASAFYYAVNRKKLLEQIDKEFREYNIGYLVFKGSEVAQYYQLPYLRTSGDMDIMVPLSNKEKAGVILESIGFKAPESKGTDHEWVYVKGNFEVELHHRLLYGDDLNNDNLTALTDTVWEHVTTTDSIYHRIEPEFHFVYLLLHLRKHFLWTGVGIRQFVDLAVMMKYAGLDYEKVEKYIEACRITQFTKTCFSLIERWFGIWCPIGASPVTDDFFISSTSTILSGGAFGNMSRESLINNSIMNTIRKHGKLASALPIIFPSWEQMKKKYPRMGRHKILLPLLWNCRMIESLFKQTAKDGITYAGKHLTMGKQEKEREDMLRAWGL